MSLNLSPDQIQEVKDKIAAQTLFTQKCHWWQGRTDKDSSGRSGPRGKFKLNGKLRNVQKVVWELYNEQEMEEGEQISTSCFNTLCIKPEHLEVGRVTFMTKNRKGRPR